MRIDEIKYSLQSLSKRRLRTSLTILSILIGITSIYALVSFGMGIDHYVNNLADEAGRDKLFIQAKGIGAPGTDNNFFITTQDIDFISKIKGVDDIIGLYFKVGEIKFDEETRYHFVAGIDPEKWDLVDEVFTVGVGTGRRLKQGEITKVILGYNYQFPDKGFKKAVKLGDKIEVNGQKFEVVGFYEEVGNPDDDTNIYLTNEAMEILYDDIKDKFGYAMIRAEKGIDPGELSEKIKEKLRKYKGQEEGKEDFFVQTFEDALATFGSVIGVINGILVLIALISLIVASVNIMNTMYTSILERTREIGVMKAIGARNRNILSMFIFESGVLGFIGGALGILLGYIIAATGGAIAASSGFASLQPIFPIGLTLGCLMFSTAVGAGAGFLPALKASKLRPVDALRYE